MTRARRAITVAALLGCVGCARRRDGAVVPATRARSDTAEAASATLDAAHEGGDRAGDSQAIRCPTRAHPPEEFSVGEEHRGPVAVGWSGRHWAVAWTERVDENETVFFARLSREGRRAGAPVRLSEPGYRAHSPALVWSGEAWTVAFVGGATERESLWLSHVDARGVAMNRPHQITARDRDDGPPSLYFDGQNVLLAWSARELEGRSAVRTLRLSAWGAQLAPPMVLAQRSDRLAHVALASAPAGSLLGWLASRRGGSAIAIESVRLDASGTPRGAVRRAGPVPLGGGDGSRRFALAHDGVGAFLAWDEVRDGLSRVFVRAPTARLEGPGEEFTASEPDEPARAPAVAVLREGLFALAYVSERSGAPHVRVHTIDAAGRSQGESVELQGHDRRADEPVLLYGDDALLVATVSPRAVSVHRVELGPCVPSEPLPIERPRPSSTLPEEP